MVIQSTKIGSNQTVADVQMLFPYSLLYQDHWREMMKKPLKLFSTNSWDILMHLSNLKTNIKGNVY